MQIRVSVASCSVVVRRVACALDALLIRLCSQRLLVLAHLLSDRQHHRLESHARELKSTNVVQKRYDQEGKLEKDVKIKKIKSENLIEVVTEL